MSGRKLILLCIIILIFSGCDKKQPDPIIIENEDLPNIFALSENYVEMPQNYLTYINDYYIDEKISNGIYDKIYTINGNLYAMFKIRKSYDEKSDINNTLLFMHLFNNNGEEIGYQPMTPNEFEATVVHSWIESENNYVTIEELNGEYTLNKLTPANELIFTVPLPITELIRSMVIGGTDDDIYIGTEHDIYVYSSKGEKICELRSDYTLHYISSAYSKRPIAKMYTEMNEVMYYYINTETQLLEVIELTISKTLYENSNIIYGGGYDYYHVTNTGIYGFDIESKTLTKILDWMNSDISYTDVKFVSVISPDKIIIMLYKIQEYNYFVHTIERIPEDQITERE